MKIFKYQKPNNEMIYFEGKKEKWEKDLFKYLKSNRHEKDCAAHSDQCLCCLEKEWIWKFIEKIIRGDYAAKKTKYEQYDLTGKEGH